MMNRYEAVVATIRDYCQQYLDEEDKSYIPHINIAIDDIDCTFWITNAFSLVGFIKHQPHFRLAICFSIGNNSKKKQRVIERLAVSGCFSGFIEHVGDRRNTYVLETDNDIDAISQCVIKIINGLNPEIEQERIKVELKRHTTFFNLDDGNCN